MGLDCDTCYNSSLWVYYRLENGLELCAECYYTRKAKQSLLNELEASAGDTRTLASKLRKELEFTEDQKATGQRRMARNRN